MKSRKEKNLYLLWKNYQRRAEVLAPMLNAQLLSLPHIFRSRVFRVIDYFIKFIISMKRLAFIRPKAVFIQAPPLFVGLPALLFKIPYVIDAHNKVFQGFWSSLPLNGFFIGKSAGLIVHNTQILELSRAKYPESNIYCINDPVSHIPATGGRDERQIIIICSFDSDEPVDVILDFIERLKDFTFIITADKKKLNINQRQRLETYSNVNLTGFLSTPVYHKVLTSSAAAVVLTTRESTQPSGACEALSSDTPLIVSKSSLTQQLFGEWAILVENSAAAIVSAIRLLNHCSIDLSKYREQWNASVKSEITRMLDSITSV